jgi:hypothetical protein
VAQSKALERAARAAYVRHVLRKKFDTRDFAHHPLLISTKARNSASVTAACVEEWASECPDCVIYRTDFAPAGTYGVVLLEFNDAGDGEYVYLVFLNDDDRQVAAIARESNFRP